MDYKYTVYMHVFPNGKVYVGITRQRPIDRWGGRGQGYKGQKFYADILEYGWNNIEHRILYSGISRDEARQHEQDLIKTYTELGKCYNVMKGGDVGGDILCEYEYNGQVLNAHELSEISPYHIPYHVITTRINDRGWTVDRAINEPIVKRDTKYEYRGKCYTMGQICKMDRVAGLTSEQLRARLSAGWTAERALTQPTNVKVQPFGVGDRIYEYNGKMYNSYELSKMNPDENVTSSTIACRINQHGWSIEDAITKPAKRYGLKYEYKGQMYTTNELADLSPVSGLKNKHIRERIKNGWPVDLAVETPILDKHSRMPIRSQANECA